MTRLGFDMLSGRLVPIDDDPAAQPSDDMAGMAARAFVDDPAALIDGETLAVYDYVTGDLWRHASFDGTIPAIAGGCDKVSIGADGFTRYYRDGKVIAKLGAGVEYFFDPQESVQVAKSEPKDTGAHCGDASCPVCYGVLDLEHPAKPTGLPPTAQAILDLDRKPDDPRGVAIARANAAADARQDAPLISSYRRHGAT
jgi:hypothetical protein